MYAKKVDLTQKEVVAALRKMDCSVFHLHTVGQGCPDLLVGIDGKTYLVEVKKDDKAKFTEAQIKFMTEWRGAPVVRINSAQDAIAFVNSVV
jgi:Holliday junction resolvase